MPASKQEQQHCGTLVEWARERRSAGCGYWAFLKHWTLPHPLQCLHKAIAICKPGTPYRDIGDVITKHAKQFG